MSTKTGANQRLNGCEKLQSEDERICCPAIELEERVPMMERTRVQFQVRVLRLKLWEKMFVCGSDISLGEWDPLKAFPLTKSLTDRWESFLIPRSALPSPGQKLVLDDVFGNYSGSTLLTDGWIIHNEENVVLLRVHGEALKFYKPSHRGKEHRVKIVPFDVRFKEIESVDDDCLPDPDPVLPDVPSFSNTLLSVLSREDPIFGQQYVNGSVFRNDVDYLVFKTRTVSLEHLAFRIELFTGMDRIGLAYALPAALPDLYGKATFPIISLKNIPIGQIDIDYMLVKTLPMDRSIRDSMAVSWGRYWKKRNTLEVGHRGMGCSYTKMATARENTIHSLSEAAKNGADYVEFDVQLTKDIRSDCSKIAVNYAAGNGLLGVNFHSEELLQDPSPLERAEKFKLVTIGEVRPRRNTFVVENESRTALPIRTPDHSRSPTPDPELIARLHPQPTPEPEPIVENEDFLDRRTATGDTALCQHDQLLQIMIVICK
ncbi:hypothetical protein TELCIR_14071 [Teladorsagia circumcincta]|uniref:GP-PDE domain-containing protein n=1 Tax=Teladorsagia circumcincta TaxID=45464 RepID=A0A2G9U207_TELCI|nr:hypothetical protein TELCIR_14071 [Teladorsagia circumcincta]